MTVEIALQQHNWIVIGVPIISLLAFGHLIQFVDNLLPKMKKFWCVFQFEWVVSLACPQEPGALETTSRTSAAVIFDAEALLLSEHGVFL